MDLRIVSGASLASVGAGIVRDALVASGRAEATLMPALGASALGVYAALGEMREAGSLDTSRLRLVQLDEYVGVGPDDPRSLLGWLRRDVATPLGVPDERIIALDGDVARYDAAVAAAGGVDVAVLGLGPNGHLGFNEPPSPADAPSREVELAAESLASNAVYWPGLPVPTGALTAGMSTILGARRTVLVVTGGRKRDVLRRTLTGPVTADLPASFLRATAAATLLADEAAWPPDLPPPAGVPERAIRGLDPVAR